MAISSTAEVYTTLQRHLDTLLIIFIMCLKGQSISSGLSTLGNLIPDLLINQKKSLPSRKIPSSGCTGQRGWKTLSKVTSGKEKWKNTEVGLEDLMSSSCGPYFVVSDGGLTARVSQKVQKYQEIG